MEGKGSFFILLFIVAFLSLALAVLAGYVFFFAGNSHSATTGTQKEDVKRPDDKDLSNKIIFEKENFNLKNTDDKRISMIQVGVEIKYNNKIKNIATKLEAYDGEIKEIIGKYFRHMTREEAEKAETIDKAKEELKKEINEILTASEKDKSPIVFDVVFNKWLYQ